ncbi:tRNA lysidine(34) synthetase TilS [Gordonia sp. (in: high G+C Gram-positive bacteria)]|uniref:tRNA lysidine(34) synthetase TilS n=1 Tax=Gordonia sp. (in: high G+C Gram-positive bacteria) TaxID=84139 RepID=UPI0016B53B67|nr:tRNA lysidine(34) synthetase TilS [Gordonia sp. (in: high G+C Gram-positive bacteria)]NLG47892.1 tRNA lysidine(34) synthetase TilS [Gordonia sp. (in: high G+C Gram-positive bacteria)]
MDRAGALTPEPRHADAQRAVIGAVRGFASRFAGADRVCVALSGGADSLALTAAAVRAGLAVHAVVVDHRLQDGSGDVAERAAAVARDVGATAEVRAVTVDGLGGLEAAARRARYAALDDARGSLPVLLGHTLDDQAETVLLGLGRGSGARSLAGMRAWSRPWGRPLLGIRRAQTRAACEAWSLPVWDDPHNDDPRFARVRIRNEVLPLLDEVLGGGVAGALARTATQLQDDADALDVPADELLMDCAYGRVLDLEPLIGTAVAVRTRVLRAWLQSVGAAEPSFRVVAAVDGLVTDWHGQGPIAVGGDSEARLVVTRRASELHVRRVPR